MSPEAITTRRGRSRKRDTRTGSFEHLIAQGRQRRGEQAGDPASRDRTQVENFVATRITGQCHRYVPYEILPRYTTGPRRQRRASPARRRRASIATMSTHGRDRHRDPALDRDRRPTWTTRTQRDRCATSADDPRASRTAQRGADRAAERARATRRRAARRRGRRCRSRRGSGSVVRSDSAHTRDAIAPIATAIRTHPHLAARPTDGSARRRRPAPAATPGRTAPRPPATRSAAPGSRRCRRRSSRLTGG